jgi:hypothetical protein
MKKENTDIPPSSNQIPLPTSHRQTNIPNLMENSSISTSPKQSNI